MSVSITLLWGTNKERKETYHFENEEQLKWFMKGVNDANGWLEYEVEEDSNLTWEELKEKQNELGRRSNPPFEVKEYRRGAGWQGVRWL